MNWNNVKLILHREIRDLLRDRRTLFMVAVLPLLLYPSLGIGMVQMMVLFTEQPRTVVILGDDHLPGHPPLLYDEGFVESWFHSPDAAKKLKAVVESRVAAEGKDADPQQQELLQTARRIEEKIAQRDRLEAQVEQAVQNGEFTVAAEKETEFSQIKRELTELFADRMQVLIIVPEGFGKSIERIRRTQDKPAEGDAAEADGQAIHDVHQHLRPRIVHNIADEKSLIAYQTVKDAMKAWELAILKQRLRDVGLDESWAAPVDPHPVNLAEPEDVSANVWSKLFPALLVLMTITGAFYPAVDVAAGEKERGTMETLLICPATRTEIVMGKFLTVLIFSMSTAVLNLASMGLTAGYMRSIAGAGMGLKQLDSLQPPSLDAILWIAVLLVPLAALFSALSLALATFARSSKEGQYYLTPLLMVTLGLTVFSLSPGIEITPFYSLMPVVGISLLLKKVMSSSGGAVYAIPVLVTSIGYCLLALWWAIEQFSREDVLFREAERFEVSLWLQHLLRDKEPTPTFAEAGFCFMLIMFLQFGAIRFQQAYLMEAPQAAQQLQIMKLLMVQQLVIIASPALFMGVILTSRPRRTFQLRLPRLNTLAVAALLPFALHPIVVELTTFLISNGVIPQLPESFAERLSVMSDDTVPLWLVLLCFAALPAVCEEIAFRGFILSGFRRSGRMWLAVVLSSLTFGVMHMIPQQVFNASLLGLVLGLIAVRGGSLLPCIVFHFLHNSLAVLRGRWGGDLPEDGPIQRFLTIEGSEVRYEWPTLVLCLLAAALLLRWLYAQNQDEPRVPAADGLPGSAPQNRPTDFARALSKPDTP